MSADVVGRAVVEIDGQVDESSLQSSIGGLTRVLAAAGIAAGAALGGGIVSATLEAADLNESINAIEVTLGSGADSFVDFGADAASSLGIAQSALNEAIVPLGSLLSNAGLGGEELSGTLQDVSTRATDVASVFNRDVNEVLDAFGAAVRGETEPIRALGVQFDAAAVAAKAVELGLADSTSEVDQAAQAQASLALIMEQTESAQGDFANTAGSLPNLMRRIAATVTDAGAQIGQAFLPIAEDVGAQVLPALENMRDFVLELIGAFQEGGLAGAIGLLRDQFSGLASTALDAVFDFIPQIIQAFGTMFPQIVQSFIQNRALVVNAFITALTGLVDALPQIVPAVIVGLRQTILLLANTLVTLAPLVLQGALDLFSGLVQAAVQILPQVVESLLILVQEIVAYLPSLVEFIVEGALALFTGIVNALEVLIPAVIEAIIVLVTAIVEALPELLPAILEGALQLLMGLVEAIVTILPIVIDAIVDLVSTLAEFLPSLISQIVDAAVSLFTGIVEALPIILPAIIQGIIRLIPALVSAIAGAVPAIVKGAVALFTGIVTAIVQTGPKILSELGRGLVDIVREVVKAAPQLLSAALEAFGALLDGARRFLPQLLSFVRRIPGMIVSGIGSLGGLLLDAGRALIGGLTDGIKNAAQGVIDAAKSVVGRVRDFLPFSPAKEGPLAGSGDPERAGRIIMERLAAGLRAASPEVEMQAALAPFAADATAGRAAVAGPGTVVNQNFFGPTTGSGRRRELEWTLKYAPRLAEGAA